MSPALPNPRVKRIPMRSKKFRKYGFISLLIVMGWYPSGRLKAEESQRLLITEFLALNSSILQDEDGDYSDWIEIYNPGPEPVSLEGWSVTDNPGNPAKWIFPAITMNPGDCRIVFASEKDRVLAGGELHTNFKLSGSGEYLALLEPGLETVSYSFGHSFPVQQRDISYGLYDGKLVYFPEPTPGRENSPGAVLLAPVFSHSRGFYNTPIPVEITPPQAGMQVYYTTDGTRPDFSKARHYTAPVDIRTTTSLSAVVVNNLGDVSPVVTHTYLFPDAIVKQPSDPPGYPPTWSPLKFSSGNAPADYEMDPQLCEDPDYKELLPEVLKSIPSVVLVTNPGYLFSHSTDPDTGGIYIYTGNTSKGNLGTEWERPVSVEFIDPGEGVDFQVNGGLLLHGGNSRVPENSQKHSFRLSFRSFYGPSKLSFNLFDYGGAVNTFNALVLRAGYNYSWVKNNALQRLRADYIRDSFAKNTQLAMGHPSAHNRFAHLYINGLYWGLYNLSEKLTNDFMESYMGGSENDWDVVKDHSGLVDGNRDAWNRLISQAGSGFSSLASYMKVQGLNPNGSVNPQYENLLDVDNLIDYMIYNFYIGNNDWDANNWIAARNRREPATGFRFFCWDAEDALLDPEVNYVNENNNGNPSMIYTKLRQNEEFRLRFADHVQRHFFHGGALTPEVTRERYTALADEIDLAIIGESARWGDYRRDVMPSDAGLLLYTRNTHWLPEVQQMLRNYFPVRSGIVLEQFRQAGLFPSLEAPIFSHYGGKISEVVELNMSAMAGDIVYTTDGTDPRMTGGAVSTSARPYLGPLQIGGSGTVNARAKENSTWSPLTTATFKSTSAGDFIVSAPIEESPLTIRAYPNPFSGQTCLEYRLDQAGAVKVDILAPDGRTLVTLFSGFLPPGLHKITWIPGNHPPGLYLYRIIAGGGLHTGKLILNR